MFEYFTTLCLSILAGWSKSILSQFLRLSYQVLLYTTPIAIWGGDNIGTFVGPFDLEQRLTGLSILSITLGTGLQLLFMQG